MRPWARVVLFTLIGMGVARWLVADSTLWLKAGMCIVTLVIEVWGLLAAVQWARARSPTCKRAVLLLDARHDRLRSVDHFQHLHALGMLAGDTVRNDMGAAATPAYLAFTCLALSLPFRECAIDRFERAPLKTAQNALTEQLDERSVDAPAHRQTKSASG